MWSRSSPVRNTGATNSRASLRRPCGCTGRTTRSPASRPHVRSPELAGMDVPDPRGSRAPSPPRGPRVDNTIHHRVAEPRGELRRALPYRAALPIKHQRGDGEEL
jgi:hypothetical protein